jgi:hypothetical protein
MTRRSRRRATQFAVAYLLGESLTHIRFETAPLDREPDNGERVRRAWILADLCHNLPAWLDPERRDRIGDGVEYMWRTASAEKRAWVRRCWDEIGYDYSWLPEPIPTSEMPETEGAEPTSGRASASAVTATLTATDPTERQQPRKSATD